MANTGLEALLQRIGGRRVGLVTGPTGWLEERGHLIDLLHARGELAALFAPEHGVRGDLQAGEHVPGGRDARTGVVAHSLYGAVKAPTAEMLDGVDVLVGCLQDAGSRCYTWRTTLAACLRACAEHGKPLLVLDRPNPLGGVIAEGNVAGGIWFPADIPMRPALTLGEELRLLAAEDRLDVDLDVVPWVEAPRESWYDSTGLLWVPPSPNLPTLESALVFAATVVLEGTNASEGRGTTRPFEIIGGPWCDGAALADDLNGRNLPGLLARPVSFVPTFSKHAGESCGGVQLHVTDRHAFETARVGLHVVDALRRVAPEGFELRAASFDARYGTATVRDALEEGAAPDDIVKSWAPELAAWRSRCAAAGVGPRSWSEG